MQFAGDAEDEEAADNDGMEAVELAEPENPEHAGLFDRLWNGWKLFYRSQVPEDTPSRIAMPES